MTNTGTADNGKRARSTPSPGKVVQEIPKSSREGFWAQEFKWFKDNPGVVKLYEDVNTTTASYLRETYGLEAHSRNTRGGKGDLYVVYPGDERATELKNRPKRPRKATKKVAASK